MVNFKLQANKTYPDVTTFTVEHKPEEIEHLFKLVANEARSRQSNYLPESAFTDYVICYSVSMIGNEPYLGSLVWNRPFYKGFPRIVTRYCVNPKYANIFYTRNAPGKGFDNLRVDVVDHIDQQIDYCSNLNYTNFFFSIEDKSPSGRRTRKICESVNKYSKFSWNISELPQLVCPDPMSNSCWQYVVYNNKPYIRSEK